MATVLVTGANRGIGLELARQYLQRGDSVIAVCRRSSPELAALATRVEEGIDVAEAEGAAELARRLAGARLDILVNNAGILENNHLESLDFHSIERQLSVNALGPLRITTALLPNLGHGSKVAIVTSRMGSMADNTSGGYYGYRMSKAAVNMAGVSLARDLARRGVAVVLLHPGYVRTGMTSGQGTVSPEQSASGLIARIQELTLGASGSFWHADGTSLPW